MSVPEQIPYVGYVANGQTTEFPITFDLHDPEYLIVTVNKEIPVVGTYTVDMNAPKVVFATAPTDGTQVELYRETELNRDTNYQKYDNSFRPEAVNYDFDKIWHVLQEQDMIDAELLARLKSEIEWRRTHDANFDELAKMRDAQVFSGLKQYIDTFIAASNPNIFEGITAGIVFALDKKSVQTHLEIIYEMLSSNRNDFENGLTEERERALSAESGLLQNIQEEALRALSVEASLQSQINANGVGNRAYKTYAAMDADKANIPAKSKVTVTNDTTSSNNGDWQWDGVVFTKSTYDPLAQAKADATEKANTAEQNANKYTDTKTMNQFNGDLVDALFAKVDSENRPVEVTGPDGKQYLVGLPASTQELILDNLERVETVESKLPQFDYDELSLVAHDILGHILFYMRNDNHLFLDHLNDSVQNSINANTSLLSDMTMSLSMTESSAIKSLTKGTFTADSAAILSMKVPATNTMDYIKMDSPYRKDDAFVHPCVIELYKPMRGYKYLMCITPYWGRNPFEENPTIYGSNDQITWTMLTGFAQPIANPPEIDEPETGEHGYLSDNWWAYDPINKELYCCYRKGYYANYPNGYSDNDRMQLLYRKTTNGLTWSKPTMFTPETLLGVDGQVAPSMIYDQVNNRWVLFYLKTNDSRIYVRFNTELKVDGWTAPQEIGFKAFADANNIKGWHIETKWVGNKLFMLIGDSTNGRYYFAVSNDDTFLNWTFSANSVLESTWTKGAYKGSFLVVPQDNGKIKLRMYFTDTGIGRFYSALSPDISIS